VITIKNMDYLTPYYECDVRVDRKTIFGNPFRIEDESLRDDALDRYRAYFYERIKKDLEFRNEAENLLRLHAQSVLLVLSKKMSFRNDQRVYYRKD